MPAARREVKFRIETDPGEPFPLPSTVKLPDAVYVGEYETPAKCIGEEIARLNRMTFIGAVHDEGESWFLDIWGFRAGLSFTITIEP